MSDYEEMSEGERASILKDREEYEEEKKRMLVILNNTENFTPLINAINKRDIDAVTTLLEEGADPNEPDKLYKWCPLKWLDFPVHYYYSDISPTFNIEKLRKVLINNGATDCYSVEEGVSGPYQFLEVYNDTKGGRSRQVKSKKIGKTRKTRKTRKSRKSRKTTKRRKHRKK
jgi:hypothetical protein